ncbi:hypothetical protein Mal52_27990 [Symmachiella dynata]|uniref:Uncharacterized protein n=1 Tax=Symmachiella dynata TaxID=2527995 RepID=A0A517ZPH9_9PLAN|nr:hypothetical protein [Symmachiella dynata]QDU44320.1 hypothetical protein Mal52_27990 [Symmachiella dynata]
MSSRFFLFFDNILFGSLVTLCFANENIRIKIANCAVDQYECDDRLRHSIKGLEKMLSTSLRRVEHIENKAMGTLLGLSVAIAVFVATTGILGKNGLLADAGPVLRNAASFFSLVAIFYLFGSGFLALSAYKVGQVYSPTLRDRSPIIEKKKEKMTILFCIEQNRLVGTSRSNLLSASFTFLRNGLVGVLALGVLVVLSEVVHSMQ